MNKKEILEMFSLKECPDEEIKPGDFYIGHRNTTQLLECKEIKDGMVIPTNLEYPYDIRECIKVVELCS